MQTSDYVVRRASRDVVDALGKIVDLVFRPQLPPGQGMPKEFPHLFSADNAHNLYYVADENGPVSMVGVLPQKVVIQGITMNVASIGSVVTLPEYQGRHISSAILHRVMADFTAEGVPLMLVSGDRGLYRRIDCVPVGRMYRVTIGKAEAEKFRFDRGDSNLLKVTEVRAKERSSYAERLNRIYHAEPYRYRRTDAEMAILLDALWFQRDAYDQRLFVIEQGGEPVAYVTPYQPRASRSRLEVMEWAGSRTAVIGSAAAILDAFGADEIRFPVHADDITMRTLVKTNGFRSEQTALQGTVRALSAAALIQSLEPLFVERFGTAAEVLQQGMSYRLSVAGRDLYADNAGELAIRLFNHDADNLGLPFVHTDDLNYI